MSTFKIDSNNDWVFEGNDLVLVEGVEEVEILLRNRIRTYFGEWFLDNTIGVPYFQEIFTKTADPQRIDQIFKDVILKTPGVTELQEFNLDIDSSTRELQLTFKVLSQDGVIELFEILGEL